MDGTGPNRLQQDEKRSGENTKTRESAYEKEWQ